jgi:cell division protease FtsH
MDGFESMMELSWWQPPIDLMFDPALLRPGRFDHQVVVSSVCVGAKKETWYTPNIPLAVKLLQYWRVQLQGFQGRTFRIWSTTALHARRNKSHVDMQDFESSKDKVMMGVERRSMVISDEEKQMTAYHEAGHTLVAKLLPGTDPIHKVTIIPRGMAMGLTQQLPTEEKHAYPREYLLNNLVIYLGGRAAEELIFKDPTTGAGNDIERATELARKMVCEWGMSDRMGPLSFGKKEEQIFLGREIAQHKDYSEVTAIAIDEEIKRMVTNAYETAKSILSTNIHLLHALARALIDREELNAEEIGRVIAEWGDTNGNSPETTAVSSDNMTPES